MNKLLRALSLIVFLFYLPQTLKAQTNTALLNNGFTHAKNNSVPTVSAPNISYQTPQIYNVNTSIVLYPRRIPGVQSLLLLMVR